MVVAAAGEKGNEAGGAANFQGGAGRGAGPVGAVVGAGFGSQAVFERVPFGIGGDMPAGRTDALGAFSRYVTHGFVPVVEAAVAVAIGLSVVIAITLDNTVIGHIGMGGAGVDRIGGGADAQILGHPALLADQDRVIGIAIISKVRAGRAIAGAGAIAAQAFGAIGAKSRLGPGGGKR